MRRKEFFMVVLMGMLAMGVSACGNEGKTAEPAEPTQTVSSKEAETEKKTEKTVLTITTWDYDTSPQFSAVVEAYEAENPNIEIKVIDTAANEYNNSLGVSLAAAQTDPDVIFVKDMGAMLPMADKGQLLPLDKFLKEDQTDVSVYSGAFEQLQYDGITYGMPYRNDWFVLYYNKDLFDKAGIEYPSNDMTWDEYVDLAAKLTSGEGSDKVYGTHNHTWQSLVGNWAVQDGEHTAVAKDYSFIKPWYEQALELQKNGFMQDYATLKTANIHYSSVFKNQQCAMMPMGTWFIATMEQALQQGEIDFNWGIARIPHPDNVESGYTVGAITPVSISAYTDQPEAAWDFVSFASSEKAADILAEVGVFTGIQTEKSIETIASNQYFPEGDSNKEALTYINLVFDRPLDPKIEEIRMPLDEVHDMIMIGAYSVDDGIEELNRRVSEIKGW